MGLNPHSMVAGVVPAPLHIRERGRDEFAILVRRSIEAVAVGVGGVFGVEVAQEFDVLAVDRARVA